MNEQPLAEQGAWLFAQACVFERGVTTLDGLPPPDRIECAFAGRSNVGKSSLVNALTRQRNLARSSNTPGRTREINFFALAPEKRAAWLVDLPGYGYARQSRKTITAWTRLMRHYLTGRQNLRRVFLLIDARHGLKNSDLAMMDIMDKAAVSYQIVLTKTDKRDAAALDAENLAALAKRPAVFPRHLATSAVTGEGIETLRAEIAALVDMVSLGYKPAKGA